MLTWSTESTKPGRRSRVDEAIDEAIDEGLLRRATSDEPQSPEDATALS
jgi:hypothetical protein